MRNAKMRNALLRNWSALHDSNGMSSSFSGEATDSHCICEYTECIEEPPITPMSTDTRATEAKQSVFIWVICG